MLVGCLVGCLFYFEHVNKIKYIVHSKIKREKTLIWH